MTLIDLSREIHHKMARLPNHPMVIIAPFSTHEEKRVADGYTFSSAVTSLNMGDHSGTHVDAPLHFDERPGAMGIDEMPLETFFTEAVCLDLSHKELKSDIGIDDLQAAERAAGIEIRPGRNNFEVHHVCRDMGFTHMEGLVNLDKLVGKGRFRFIGFPLKIRGGTGSPIRAVAWLE